MKGLKAIAKANGARCTKRVRSFRGTVWTFERRVDGNVAYVCSHPGTGMASFCAVDGTSRDAVPFRRVNALLLRWARGEDEV
jgi:hypothetical protein